MLEFDGVSESLYTGIHASRSALGIADFSTVPPQWSLRPINRLHRLRHLCAPDSPLCAPSSGGALNGQADGDQHEGGHDCQDLKATQGAGSSCQSWRRM